LAEPLASSLSSFIKRLGCETIEVGDPGIFNDLDDSDDIKKIDALLRARGKNE
jgi:hypothetical protein